jgi:hypothetical protein
MFARAFARFRIEDSYEGIPLLLATDFSGVATRNLHLQILYTNKRVKSLDKPCYGYRRSRTPLAPRIFGQAERKMRAKNGRVRATAVRR